MSIIKSRPNVVIRPRREHFLRTHTQQLCVVVLCTCGCTSMCALTHTHTHTHTLTQSHLVCRVVAFSMQVTRPCQPFAIVLLAFWFIDLNFSLLDFPPSLSPPARPLLLAAQSLLFLILRFLCFRLFKYLFFLASSSCSCSSSCSWFRSSYFDRLLFGSRSFRHFGGLSWGLEFGFRFMFFFFATHDKRR